MTRRSPVENDRSIQAAGAPAADNPAPIVQNSAPASVLVVDDEPLIRWSLAETLGDCGYRVIEAGDAASAIDAFSSSDRPRAVLLDVCLPDGNGLGVLTAMRAISPRVPVILITAYGNSDLRDEAQQRGAFAVLDKPFEMADLPPLVDRALGAPLQTAPG
jgi:DNA-binding NtrC family response regulator